MLITEGMRGGKSMCVVDYNVYSINTCVLLFIYMVVCISFYLFMCLCVLFSFGFCGSVFLID